MSLKGRDVVSAKDLSRGEVELLIDEAERLRDMLKYERPLHIANGKVVMTVFLEPSTRTRLSFQYAATYLGALAMDFGATEISSIQKGESFEDTMRMVDGYGPDAIVLRQSVPGNAAKAAEICSSPVINAGDGANEHPTQALLDVYTIRRELGRIDGVSVGIMGDLRYGRTVKSLSLMLDKFNGVRIFYIAPKALQIRQDVLNELRNVKSELVENVEEVAKELDVLYVTRIQKERFADPSEYERLKGSYNINRKLLEGLPRIPIIMHPLPRVDELSPDVDQLPQAKYFEQAKNGLYMRMALLKEVLGI